MLWVRMHEHRYFLRGYDPCDTGMREEMGGVKEGFLEVTMLHDVA